MVSNASARSKRASDREPKAKRHPATYRLTLEARGMLTQLSEKRGISMASLVELAVRQHYENPIVGKWVPSEEKIPVTYRLTSDVLDMLAELAKADHIPLSSVVETAVRRYFHQYCN